MSEQSESLPQPENSPGLPEPRVKLYDISSTLYNTITEAGHQPVHPESGPGREYKNNEGHFRNYLVNKLRAVITDIRRQSSEGDSPLKPKQGKVLTAYDREQVSRILGELQTTLHTKTDTPKAKGDKAENLRKFGVTDEVLEKTERRLFGIKEEEEDTQV